MSLRLAVLGDSLSEGVGDPLPDRTLRGWARLVAVALGAETTHLALRGATAADMRAEQLAPALAACPDVATALVGVNDVTEPGFDPARFAADLTAVVAPLRELGAAVLVARLHDVEVRLPLPRRTKAVLRARIDALNAAVDTLAATTGALVLDLGVRPDLLAGPVWSLDRLHPNEAGHRAVARAALDLLAAQGLAEPGLALPPDAGAGRLGQARWLLTDGGPWLAGVYLGHLRRRLRGSRP